MPLSENKTTPSVHITQPFCNPHMMNRDVNAQMYMDSYMLQQLLEDSVHSLTSFTFTVICIKVIVDFYLRNPNFTYKRLI